MNPALNNAKYQELARRYGLAPVPESVVRLTELVARQDADLDTVGRVINQDATLTSRLLRAANPRARSEQDYQITTVDDALMRLGVGCVLLLAMGAPLSLALGKTFQTMLGMKLESIHPRDVLPFSGNHVLGTIHFSGKADGKVCLRLSNEGSRLIASRILGQTVEQLTNPADVNDAVGELLNIIAGNFKSNLCDAGLDCRLHTPSVAVTNDFAVANTGGSVERMAFRALPTVVCVDLMVNPWNE